MGSTLGGLFRRTMASLPFVDHEVYRGFIAGVLGFPVRRVVKEAEEVQAPNDQLPNIDQTLLDLAITQRNSALDRCRELESRLQLMRDQLPRDTVSMVATLASLLAQSRARGPARAQESVDGKSTYLVLVTSTGQLPHLRALLLSASQREHLRIVVFSYIDVNSTGIRDLCVEYELTLLQDFTLQTDCGHYEQYSVLEDSLVSFPLGAAAHVVALEDRSKVDLIDSVLGETRRQIVLARSCERVLHGFSVALLITFEDNAEHDTGIWTTVARNRGIGTVIVPFTIADQLEPAESHHHDRAFWADENIFNRLLRSQLPKWILEHRGRTLCRRMGLMALVAETLGFAPPNPWILNSSKSDAVLVESDAMRTHYRQLGLPESQLVVCGSLIDDAMHAAALQRSETRRKLSLSEDSLVLLCAFPPNQFTAVRQGLEFQNFREIIDYWFGQLNILRESGWEVVVKPHPAAYPDDVAYMKSLGFLITDLETNLLIPACDVYNACVSSTIRWALASAKPVINFDVFKYGYKEFEGIPAVITVSTCEAFASEISLLSNDRDHLTTMKARAERVAPRWGMLDGRSGQRIFETFDRLASAEAICGRNLDRLKSGSPGVSDRDRSDAGMQG
jgi:hypothetical protein